jgi:hypothetical protein
MLREHLVALESFKCTRIGQVDSGFSSRKLPFIVQPQKFTEDSQSVGNLEKQLFLSLDCTSLRKKKTELNRGLCALETPSNAASERSYRWK